MSPHLLQLSPLPNLWLEDRCPRPRYKEYPKIERTGDGERSHWFIRPYVDVLRGTTLDRVKRRIILGRCEAMGKREAIAKKNEIMATINGYGLCDSGAGQVRRFPRDL